MKHSIVGRIAAHTLLLSMRLAHWGKLIQWNISVSHLHQLQAGGVVVFANHPSLLETIAIRYALDRMTNGSVWSVADERLFPSGWYDAFQCIPVCRASKRSHPARQINDRALCTSQRILSHYGIVVVYPEGTRTCNAIQTMSDFSGQRRVGICKDTFLKAAAKQGSLLQPVWIEHGDCSTPQGFIQGYLKLLRGIPITLQFSQTYTGPVSPQTITEALLETAMQKIT